MSAWEPKIDKGIPIPPVSRPSNYKYPFHKLEIGESIFYPEGIVKIGTLQGAIQNFQKKHKPKRLTCQVNPAAKGARVWRIADLKAEKNEKPA